MYIYVVSKRSVHTLSSEVHGVNTKIRPLYQVVAWKRSITMTENSKSENRLREVPVIKLSGKMLVFEGWSHIEVRLYSYFEKGCRKKCARDDPER